MSAVKWVEEIIITTSMMCNKMWRERAEAFSIADTEE